MLLVASGAIILYRPLRVLAKMSHKEANKSQKLVIGLSGGIGCGKTLVANHLQTLGCFVIDADMLAQQLLDDSSIIQMLVDWWGEQVIGTDGRVDRQAVARIVFDNPAQLRRLESLIHPLVHAQRHQLRRQAQADSSVTAIVEDCPLLLEKGLDAECDVVIFVCCDRDQQVARVAKKHGWTETDLWRREKNQWPLDIKADQAHYVVDNNAAEADTLSHVRRLLSQILHRRSC